MAKAAPAPLSAQLLDVGVPKGAAAPVEKPPRETLHQEDATSGMPRSRAARRPVPEPVPPPVEEPRLALTVRLPVSTHERLREAAFRLRQEKQVLVDNAIIAFLSERGF